MKLYGAGLGAGGQVVTFTGSRNRARYFQVPEGAYSPVEDKGIAQVYNPHNYSVSEIAGMTNKALTHTLDMLKAQLVRLTQSSNVQPEKHVHARQFQRLLEMSEEILRQRVSAPMVQGALEFGKKEQQTFVRNLLEALEGINAGKVYKYFISEPLLSQLENTVADVVVKGFPVQEKRLNTALYQLSRASMKQQREKEDLVIQGFIS